MLRPRIAECVDASACLAAVLGQSDAALRLAGAQTTVSGYANAAWPVERIGGEPWEDPASDRLLQR
jgi:hypothetical protein